MSVNEFIKEKLNNLISYIQKTLGSNCKLYNEIFRFKNDIVSLISYADMLKKVCYIKEGHYELPKEKIIEYLINNMEVDMNFVNTEEGIEFASKIKSYLELFVNVICNN